MFDQEGRWRREVQVAWRLRSHELAKEGDDLAGTSSAGELSLHQKPLDLKQHLAGAVQRAINPELVGKICVNLPK